MMVSVDAAGAPLVPGGGEGRYPAKPSKYPYETELVVALAKGGRRIDAMAATTRREPSIPPRDAEIVLKTAGPRGSMRSSAAG